MMSDDERQLIHDAFSLLDDLWDQLNRHQRGLEIWDEEEEEEEWGEEWDEYKQEYVNVPPEPLVVLDPDEHARILELMRRISDFQERLDDAVDCEISDPDGYYKLERDRLGAKSSRRAEEES